MREKILIFIFFCINATSLFAQKTIEEYKQLLENYKAEGNKAQQANIYNKMAFIYWESNAYKDAIENFSRSLEINKLLGNQNGVSGISNNIGAIYMDLDKFDKALPYFEESLSIARKSGNKPQGLSCLMNLVNTYDGLKQFNKSISSANEGLSLAQELNDTKTIRTIYKKLSDSYRLSGNIEKSVEYLNLFSTFDKHIRNQEATELEKKSQEQVIIANQKVLEKDKQLGVAVDKLEVTKDSLDKIGKLTKEQQMKIELDSLRLGESRLKLESAQRTRNFMTVGFIIISIFLISFVVLFRQKQKANKLLAEQKIELEKLSIVARETDNAVVIMNSSGDLEWVNHGFTRMFGLTLEQHIDVKGVNIIEAVKRSQENNHVPEKILECIEEKKTVHYDFEALTPTGIRRYIQATVTPVLDDKGELIKIVAIDSDITRIKEAEEEITLQKNKVEEQNWKIKESIVYAERIQKSILPGKEQIDYYFDSFIIYRPKDIVSGDFYWFTTVNAPQLLDLEARYGATLQSEEKTSIPLGEKVFVAVVDCTGHGVPGAFMSMIGNRLLNEIITRREIHDPGKILSALNIEITEALKQKQTKNDDGMDICLCCVETMISDVTNEKICKVTFAGAKRPLYYFSGNDKTLHTIKGTRRHLGGYDNDVIDFESKIIYLQNGDLLYLSSDGLIDQISQEKEKFGTPRFLEILNTITHLPMSEQQSIIENSFNKHMGDAIQRDDITILGIKIRV